MTTLFAPKSNLMPSRLAYLMFSLVLALLTPLTPGKSLAQRTPADTQTVYATNGALITATITNPAIQFVTFEVVIAARYKDPGHLTQPAEVTLKAPIGSTATLQMEKVFPNIGSGKPYAIQFADGKRAIAIEEGDLLEEYARYLSRLFPGITAEDLRRMYSPEELAQRLQNFKNFNDRDIAADGIKATAILQKDTCAPQLKTYRARLIVDLRGVDPARRATQIKVAGAIRTLEPEPTRAASIRIGGLNDGNLKGKPLILLASREPQLTTLRFTQYSKGRQLRSLKAKRNLVYTHRVHGLMLKAGLPKIRKVRNVTVDQIGPDGKSIYSVCAPLVAKKPVKLNGFKPG